MKKQSFILGAFLLAVRGVICKVLGAIYKIPLTNILGSQGMGIYYLVFPVYAFLLSVSSSSFTTAISRQISNLVSQKKHLLAYKTFKASTLLLVCLGAGAGVLLACFSRVIAALQGLENAFICYLVVAPSILLVSISCAFKGYFQGLQNMTPTATSQVVGQLFKLSTGFLLAKILCGKGVVFGAIGALLGVLIAETITTLFFVVFFFIFKIKNKDYFRFVSFEESEKKVSLKTLAKQIFKMSLPFTISSVILPMSMVIDSFLIVNILKSMKFDKLFATSLLGLNSGIVNTLVSLPSTLSVAVCMSIVPYITFALSKKDYEGINKKTTLAFKLAILVSLPCVFIFVFFAPYILKLLYSATFSNSYEFNVASSLLTLSSINILYLSFLQISTALLQSINRSYIPVISLSISLVVKVICEVILLNIPSVNIAGAVISNAVCYLVSSTINIYYFKTKMSITFSFYKTIVTPFVSSCAMSLMVFILLKIFTSSKVGICFALLIGALVYGALILLLKTFSKEEVLHFKPKKQKKET